MAEKKGGKARFGRLIRTIVIKLISAAGTGFFYVTKRRRALPKLSLMKFDPVINKHVLFLEGKK
jgi:large subunit ribosomal protein L33